MSPTVQVKNQGPKGEKIWRHAIMRAVKRRLGDGKTQRLEQIAEALIQSALSGDVVAIKEIGDRLDGKPNVSVDVNNRHDFTELLKMIAASNAAAIPLTPTVEAITDASDREAD